MFIVDYQKFLVKEQEKKAFISALIRSKGNVAKAAGELGMSRQLLQYHLKKYGIKKEKG